MPPGAVSAVLSLLLKIGEGSHAALEGFKTAFGGSAWSSAYDWAITDLSGLVESRADNAALFVDSVWKCIEQASAQKLPVPSEKIINRILAEHGVPLAIAAPSSTGNGETAARRLGCPCCSRCSWAGS
jgi:hypothetical protein